ncbi:MAG: hypothetical protein ABIJ09_08880 [Pseudomonadota bacterium]
MMRISAALALLPLATGCYIFSEDNRPCTAIGECKPGFTCVEGLCVKSGVKQIGEACLDTGECVDSSVCAEAYCDDSARTACDTAASCGPEGDDKYLCRNKTCNCKRVCRPRCDFPDFAKCGLGQLCWFDPDQELGFCQEGNCGERDDGTSVGTCLSSEVCLEFHGKGSGLCNPMCTLLEQNQLCQNPPVPDGVLCCAPQQNCEHIPQLWGLPLNPTNEFGVCFDTGTQGEGDPCSNDPAQNRFCTRGNVCGGSGFCVKYCNLWNPGTQPACSAGQNCIALQGAESLNLPYGWCRDL